MPQNLLAAILLTVTFTGTALANPPASPSLLDKAQQGDPHAQYQLALLYQTGNGVPQDDVQAVRWMTAAAEQHLPMAELALGLAYDRGLDGVTIDYAVAAKWLSQGLDDIKTDTGAEAQVDSVTADAALELGLLAYNGVAIPQDYQRAVSLLTIAANLGSAQAAGMLGDIYNNGLLGTVDYDHAAQWYAKGAVLGWPAAMNQLAYLYEKGRGVPKDPATAMLWYKQAALSGNAAAQENMGRLYWYGDDGITVDQPEAVNWYKKSAAQGLRTSESMLSYAYRVGIGVPADYATALAWAQKAAAQGDALSANTVGYSLLFGRSIPQDTEQACIWLQLAWERADTDDLKQRAAANLVHARMQLTDAQLQQCADQAARLQIKFQNQP